MKLLWRALKFAAKAILVIVGVIICLVVVEFVTEAIYPAGIETKSVQRASAFLFSNTEFHDLPRKVEITVDGIKSVFYKDTQPYNDLVQLLHDGRSEELFEQAGRIPRFPGISQVCGEMTISSYGLTSHFRIIRSDTNQSFYWIALPKLTSPGTSFPFFTVDPRVIAFLRAQKGEDAAAKP